MNTYYTNNRLKNNVKKTKILIISNDEEIKKREETILNIKLKKHWTNKNTWNNIPRQFEVEHTNKRRKKLPNN